MINFFKILSPFTIFNSNINHNIAALRCRFFDAVLVRSLKSLIDSLIHWLRCCSGWLLQQTNKKLQYIYIYICVYMYNQKQKNLLNLPHILLPLPLPLLILPLQHAVLLVLLLLLLYYTDIYCYYCLYVIMAAATIATVIAKKIVTVTVITLRYPVMVLLLGILVRHAAFDVFRIFELILNT